MLQRENTAQIFCQCQCGRNKREKEFEKKKQKKTKQKNCSQQFGKRFNVFVRRRWSK